MGGRRKILNVALRPGRHVKLRTCLRISWTVHVRTRMSCSWSPVSTTDSEGERCCVLLPRPSLRRGNCVRRTTTRLEGSHEGRYEVHTLGAVRGAGS